MRVGLDLNFSDQWSARVQLRSGQHKSQQSPHITIYDFDGGDTGPYQFDFDYWYLSYKTGSFEAWAGRNELSFWHQDDLFLIDNITFAGVGGSYRQQLGEGRPDLAGQLCRAAGRHAGLLRHQLHRAGGVRA